MKKKKVLQIKPLPRNRAQFEMCARAAVKNIDHERYLIVWVYDIDDSPVPALTIACTKSEYALYDMDCGKWRTCAIDNLTGYATNFDNAEMSDEDLKKVKKFMQIGERHKNTINYRYWSDMIDQKRKDMRWQEYQKESDRRTARLHERCDSVLDVPEEFNEWINNEFKFEHTLTYTKKGRWAKVTCSNCGKTMEYIFQEDYFNDAYKRKGPKPYHNEKGYCTACGETGTFKAAGKYKGVYGRTKSAYMIQPTKVEGRHVIRYFQHNMNQGAEFEEAFTIEIARAYLEQGKKDMQIDYHKQSYYTGATFWDDCNLNGLRKIKLCSGKMWKDTLKELKGTPLQYSGIEGYIDRYSEGADIVGYFRVYNCFPGMELLTKMKLYKLVHRLAGSYNIDGYINPRARKTQNVLKIEKPMLKKLIEYAGDVQLLEVMQYETRNNLHLKDDVENWYAYTFHRISEYESIRKYMSLEKFMNYVEKITKLGENIARKAQLFIDYLQMRDEMGFDMNNTRYLFPKAMEKEHDELVELRDKKRQDKRKEEKEKQFQDIRKNYEKLCKMYKFKKGMYVIRPSASASEIIEEGRLQHHCVGSSDNYMRKHNDGETYILLLRKADEENKPFVTVEIKPDASIVQWYGPHDKKDNKEIGLHREEIDKWLQTFTEAKGRKKTSKKKLKETNENDLAYAV